MLVDQRAQLVAAFHNERLVFGKCQKLLIHIARRGQEVSVQRAEDHREQGQLDDAEEPNDFFIQRL